MRIFVAIDMPQIDTSFLEHTGVKSVNHFHITLKFLGDCRPEEVEQVKQLLATVPFKPFTLTTTLLGAFPNTARPNVLWLGVKHHPKLIQLQQSIESRLKQWQPEKQWIPHITLARAKSTDGRAFLAQQLSRTIDSRQVPINHFTIYQSILDQGVEYVELKRF